MCISAATAALFGGGALAAKAIAPKGPSQGELQAQAKAQVTAEKTATDTAAAQAANSKLAQKNKARASSLLATGAPADAALVSAGGKTSLGQ